MGAALMGRTEMVNQPQGLHVELRDTIVADVGDEQVPVVRRELNVVRIVERSVARPQKLDTKRIARDGRRRERQQKGDQENEENFRHDVPHRHFDMHATDATILRPPVPSNLLVTT